MDTYTPFLILLGLVLSVIAIRNGKNANLFTFPFLFPAVTVAFVLVEFGDFIMNAGTLYQIYKESGVVAIALFMIASGALFGLLGHWLGSWGKTEQRPADRRRPPPPHIARYMHFSSIALGLVSLVAFAGLITIAGGIEQYIFFSGAYSLEWRGLPVYLVFIVQFGYVSIAIQLWLWLRTGRSHHLIWALVFTAIPLINVIFVFRRGEVIKLGIVYGYFLTNYGIVRIGRFTALSAIVGMYAILKIFPLLRNEAGKQLGLDALVDKALTVESYAESEIGSGFLRIYHTLQSGIFENGAIFYNAVIGQFVPAGLVGAERKAALMMPVTEYYDTAFSQFLFYISPMGFAQAYQQFWLFGGLIFLPLGYYLAWLERDRFRSPRKEIFLVLIIPVAVTAASADLSLIVPQTITFLAIVWLTVPAWRTASSVRLPAPRYAT